MSWYDDHKQLVDFAHAMHDAGAAELEDVVDRPYKYQAYYDSWVENNFPQEEDETWDEWVEAIKPDE